MGQSQNLKLQRWAKCGKLSLPFSHLFPKTTVSADLLLHINTADCTAGVRMLEVVLPTIALLLSNSQTNTTAVTTHAISQLLWYATSSPSAFKEAANKLDISTRELLEQSIRHAVGGPSLSIAFNATKPQISLRSFQEMITV
jgi:uncharacterized protein (DUF2267 family)